MPPQLKRDGGWGGGGSGSSPPDAGSFQLSVPPCVVPPLCHSPALNVPHFCVAGLGGPERGCSASPPPSTSLTAIKRGAAAESPAEEESGGGAALGTTPPPPTPTTPPRMYGPPRPLPWGQRHSQHWDECTCRGKQGPPAPHPPPPPPSASSSFGASVPQMAGQYPRMRPVYPRTRLAPCPSAGPGHCVPPQPRCQVWDGFHRGQVCSSRCAPPPPSSSAAPNLGQVPPNSSPAPKCHGCTYPAMGPRGPQRWGPAPMGTMLSLWQGLPPSFPSSDS